MKSKMLIAKKKINNLPKITIITVVLNGEKTIGRCIRSVANQSYPRKKIEHIVIDGGSKDKTLSVIKKYKNNLAYWHTKKDKGIYDAMNAGIKKSKGEIIGILNSDDYFNKNALKKVSGYFKKYEIDFLFGSVKKSRIYHNYFPNKIWFTFNIYPSHSVSFFIRRKAQKKLGYYNTSFKYSADRDLVYRIIRKKLKGTSTKKNEVLGTFSLSGISSRVSYFEKITEEFRIRLSNKENLLKIVLIMTITVIYHFLKKIQNRIFKK